MTGRRSSAPPLQWRRHALLVVASLLATAGCTTSAGQTGTPVAGSHRTHRVPPSTSATSTSPNPHHTRATKRPRRPPRTTHQVPGVPTADLPVARLTPGAILTGRASVVCVSGYSSRVRDVPESENAAVYVRYGIVHVPYAHEVDHLVSLELGGSNAITNLWPEPYAGRWGARTKDVLENRLHDLVCSGTLSLAFAQHIEATNWVSAYRRYVSTSPPAAPRAHPTTSSPPRWGGPCKPGYTPCLPVVGDLDCSDIPSYDRPVRVTGSDPYRLDGDGDGYGCE